MKAKNILVITYWSYDNALISTYTIPYLEIIKKNIGYDCKIFLVTLSPKNNFSSENYNKTKIFFLEKGVQLVNFNYKPFGISMFFRLIFILSNLFYLCIKKNISFIHSWCTPGGAIGYFLSILTHKPLILDSFEPHSESMIETNTWKKDSLVFRALFKLEKLQLKRATHVICTTKSMIAYSQKKYEIVKKNYFVKPACVDLNIFKPIAKNYDLVEGIDENSVVCVYAGKFGGIYLENEVFDFFKVAHNIIGENFKVLLLSNEKDETISKYCLYSHLDENVIIKKFVIHQDVPKYMALGDFGICPVKPVPTKKFCTPIKNGEYWAMGLPVIITKNISDDSAIITSNKIGYELQDLSIVEYTKAIETIIPLTKNIKVQNKIRSIAYKYRNYSIAEGIYKIIYA